MSTILVASCGVLWLLAVGAGMAGLWMLMARSRGKFAAHLLFLQPVGAGDDWTQTDLWSTAAAIPGVEVAIDSDGRESVLFGALTSGLTLLYDASGRLLFEGGITPGRGHEGENPGADAIASLLRGRSPERSRVPVFGCSLKTPDKEIGDDDPSRPNTRTGS